MEELQQVVIPCGQLRLPVPLLFCAIDRAPFHANPRFSAVTDKRVQGMPA